MMYLVSKSSPSGTGTVPSVVLDKFSRFDWLKFLTGGVVVDSVGGRDLVQTGLSFSCAFRSLVVGYGTVPLLASLGRRSLAM